MASGSFESNYGINLEIGCEWTSSANVNNNTSTVNVKVYLHHYEIYCAALPGSYVSAGADRRTFSRAVSSSSNSYQKTYIADETFTVAHSSDGTKTLTVSAGWVFNGTYNGTYVGTLSVSGSAVLDTIPRASDFTAPASLVPGEELRLSVSSASPNFTHKAVITVGGETWRSGFGGSTIVMTPPATLARGVTSSRSAQGTITLETYNGQTAVGTKTKNVTVTVPDTDDFKPDFTLSFTAYSDCALAQTLGAVAKLSSGTVSVTGASAKYGASVSSYSLTLGDERGQSTSLTVQSLPAGEIPYSATVTDSRGISKTKSGSVSVIPYNTPYPTNVSVSRCDSTGDDDDSGEYLSVTSGVQFSSLEGQNTATLTLTVTPRRGGNSTVYTLTPGTANIIDAHALHTKSYDATVSAFDCAGEGASWHTVIPTSRVDFHLKDGSARLGGYIERAGFECDMAAHFGASVYIDDKPVSDFVTERGEQNGWRWKKYASGDTVCFGIFDGQIPSVPTGVFTGEPESAVITADGGRRLVIKIT